MRLELVVILLVAAGAASGAAGAVFDVTAYGADPAHGGNDRAAAQAALEAACAAGGGEVHFPAGFYRMGREHGAGGAFYSGLQVHCDNITITGEGDSSVLLPLNSGGQTVIAVCASFTGPFGDHTCDPNLPVQDVTIRDLKIWDDYPLNHCIPSFGFSCSSEESHGITIRNGHNVTVLRVTLESLGDESVTIGGGSSGVTVVDNDFVDCPSLSSGGSCLELDWGSNYTVSGNSFEGGRAGGNSLIAINNNRAEEVNDVRITRNHLFDGSTSYSDIVEFGILLGPNNAALRDIRIDGNLISLDFTGRKAIVISTSAFEVEGLSLYGNAVLGVMDLTSLKLRDASIISNTSFGSAFTSGAALSFAGSEVLVESNFFAGHRRGCITIEGLDGASSDVTLRKNYCQTNTDAIPEAAISMSDANCNPLDGVAGQFVVDENWIVPPSGGAVSNAIRLSSCSQATVLNNVVQVAGRSTVHGVFGGAVIAGNVVDGATSDGIRVGTIPAQVFGNTLIGGRCVALDGTQGGTVADNDTGSCTIPIEEINGADQNSCWNNVGVSDGCSLQLECQDGIDNDGDGLVDAGDPQCTPLNPHHEGAGPLCGAGFEAILPLLGWNSIRRRLRRRSARRA